MNKNIKRLIACMVALGAFSTISSLTNITAFDLAAKAAYASSYSPSSDELSTLTVTTSNNKTIPLREESYYGETVKLNDEREYYLRLTDKVDEIKIKAKAEGSKRVVKIFLSKDDDAKEYNSGDELPLIKGENTVYVRVYESSKDFKDAKKNGSLSDCENEYVINILKIKESSYEDNNQDPVYLSDIKLSKGNISFLKSRTEYDVKVDSSVKYIKITAKPEDSNYRVRINGKEVNSENDYKKEVSLDSGKNEIKIKVTDSSDNQRTYTLNVTRGSSSDSDEEQDDIYLDNLELSEGNISFDNEKTSYNVDVDNNVNSIKITAEPADDNVLVTVDGKEVYKSNDYKTKVTLKEGKNVIPVVVKDEINDLKRTYKITINRKEVETNNNNNNNNANGGTNSNNGTNNNGSTSENKTSSINWIKTEKGCQYKDVDGKIIKGKWLQDNNTKEYYYLNEEGYRASGWVQYSKIWYYLDDSGVMLTGWRNIKGTWYYLNPNGAMQIGWFKDPSDGKWYYLNSDGAMQVGWIKDKDTWYFLSGSGAMQTGWLTDGNSRYYLDENGAMVTGTRNIDGKIYTFNGSGALASQG